MARPKRNNGRSPQKSQTQGASSGVQPAGCGVIRRATSSTVAESYGQDLVSKPLRLHVEEARQQYRAAKNAARKAVQRDRRLYWQQKAVQLEHLFKKGDLHAAYREVKLRTDVGGKPRMMPENMRRVDGDIVRGRKENAENLLERNYHATLLNVSRQTTPNLSILEGRDKMSGADIDDMLLIFGGARGMQ